MSKLVVINLGGGDLANGFPHVTAQFWTTDFSRPEQFVGNLPPAPDLVKLYQHWRLIYRCLCNRHSLRSSALLVEDDRLDDDILEIEDVGLTNVSQVSFDELCQQLCSHLNTWLSSDGFLRIERQLRSHLHPIEDVRIILETDDERLRRLPWHQWDWFQDYPKADIAFSKIEHRHVLSLSPKSARNQIRILAILGNSQGIDLNAEVQFLNNLPNAEIQFLANPSRQQFNAHLWDPQGWDILFFAGHSQTEEQTGRLYINEDRTNNSITIEQLEEALKAAIEQGLKLAIFNSCDGLGLALALEQLQIPVVIVMQEPVPNHVAQAFFDYFLENFVGEHLPLYLSIRRARRKLQGLENEYPGASWLPVICQNPSMEPPTWTTENRVAASPDHKTLPGEKTVLHPHQEWGDIPNVSVFFGRETEMATLKHWVIDQHSQLITILGMGGMGKTTLLAKLARQIQHEFHYLIWRSLRHAPPLDQLLTELIQFLSNQQDVDLPETMEGKVSHFLHQLRQHRCLVLLDNAESILQGELPTGGYSSGYEDYGYLFKQLGENQHQSCLILTSREKPREIALLEGETSSVRSLLLRGLTQVDGQAIFQEEGCFGLSQSALHEVCDHYAGNPLALKILASTVQELFEGDMTELMPYLQQGRLHFADINNLLEGQFNRLSPAEQQVLYWLSINREGISLAELETDILSETIVKQLLEALMSLGRRCLIERNKKQWSLQPVVMEYVSHRLVIGVYAEIMSGKPLLLRNYALIKAQSKDYIRQAQIRFILKPLVDQLLDSLGSIQAIEQHLRSMLIQLKSTAPLQPGYVGGNILNLLCYLKADLKGFDFSNLAVWQAYLLGVNLHDVNFAHADLSKSVISDTLSATLTVTFSPDGTLFATGNADGEVRIWQTKDGRKRLSCEGHQSWVWSVAFSPDGKTLASGSNDHTVKLWDASTGQCLRTFSGHTNWVWSVAFSPDGKTLASGSNDHTVKLWDTSTGQCLKTLHEHTGAVWSVAFSPDGQTLLSSGDDTIRLWDAKTGQLLKTLDGHTDYVRSIAFSPDGKTAISGSHDTTIRLWDLASGNCLNVFRGHPNYVLSVAFNPNGRTIASSSHDTTIRLWDLATGDCLKVFQGHPNGVWSMAFHPNGEMLVSGSHDSTIRLWNTSIGHPIKTIQGYSDGVRSLAFSPDCRLLASGGDDKALKIWDIQSRHCLYSIREHSSWVWHTVFSPDGRILASSGDSTIRLWNPETGQLIKTLHGHLNWVMSIAFHPDGETIASSSIDGTIRFWHVHSGQCLKTLSGLGRVWSIVFSPDGTVLASAGEGNTITLWDGQSGNRIATLEGHLRSIFAVVFSPDGKTIASGGIDGSIRLWDRHSGECLKTFHCLTQVWTVAFSPDGTVLASGGGDCTVKLWDIQSEECLNTLKGHTREVWKIVFCPNSPMLASGGQDGTIIIWNRLTGECMNTLRAKRPYEGMNITGITGITEAQKATLKALGASVE
jgi:WD40 repeat protein